jgi:hypothetical protein
LHRCDMSKPPPEAGLHVPAMATACNTYLFY